MLTNPFITVSPTKLGTGLDYTTHSKAVAMVATRFLAPRQRPHLPMVVQLVVTPAPALVLTQFYVPGVAWHHNDCLLFKPISTDNWIID
jgi:hypothetical protein